MYVDIKARGLNLSSSLENHIRKKVSNAYHSANRRIGKVVVRLFNEDVNYKRKARSCRIQISIKGQPDIIANHRSSNIYKAVNVAVKTSSNKVRDKLDKIRKFKYLKYQTKSHILA